MGQARIRKEKFFSNHPICCFCGGHRSASTLDHIPSRSFFRNRRWPEGYVFPACEECNAATSGIELITAVVFRMASSQQDVEETVKHLREMRRRHPDIMQSLFPTSTAIRRWLRESKLSLPPGTTTKDLPLVSLAHPEIRDAVRLYARKIFLSIFYKHTSVIFPSGGEIHFGWYTNGTPSSKVPKLDLLDGLQSSGSLKRGNIELSDQFRYRYGFTPEGAGVVHISFNEGVAMYGVLLPEPTSDEPDVHALAKLKPFSHSDDASSAILSDVDHLA